MFPETSPNKKSNKIIFSSTVWIEFIYNSLCWILLPFTSTQLWTQIISKTTPRLLSIILRIAMFTYSNILSGSFARARQVEKIIWSDMVNWLITRKRFTSGQLMRLRWSSKIRNFIPLCDMQQLCWTIWPSLPIH